MTTKTETQPAVKASEGFRRWLKDVGSSLALTTYQANKLFFIGLNDDDELSLSERTFERCMGLHASGNSLWLSSFYQLWRLENIIHKGERRNGLDRLYAPQNASVTGVLNIHDLAIDRNGRAIFVNTLFNCLATTSDSYSFEPVWTPPFISEIIAEDRCHLNGLAMENGVPRYVTAIAQSDEKDAWRESRVAGGCVIDVLHNKIVVEGLSMPHSPRLYKDRLWLLNSGRGEFGCIVEGQFKAVVRCPGYLRGLSFIGDYAIIGASKARDEAVFADLPLGEMLAEEKVDPVCGLFIVDLKQGKLVHSLLFEDPVRELFDVAVLPDVKQAAAIGIQNDDIQKCITIGGWHPKKTENNEAAE